MKRQNRHFVDKGVSPSGILRESSTGSLREPYNILFRKNNNPCGSQLRRDTGNNCVQSIYSGVLPLLCMIRTSQYFWTIRTNYEKLGSVLIRFSPPEFPASASFPSTGIPRMFLPRYCETASQSPSRHRRGAGSTGAIPPQRPSQNRYHADSVCTAGCDDSPIFCPVSVRNRRAGCRTSWEHLHHLLLIAALSSRRMPDPELVHDLVVAGTGAGGDHVGIKMGVKKFQQQVCIHVSNMFASASPTSSIRRVLRVLSALRSTRGGFGGRPSAPGNGSHGTTMSFGTGGPVPAGGGGLQVKYTFGSVGRIGDFHELKRRIAVGGGRFAPHLAGVPT